MSTFETDKVPGTERPERNWAVEVLVVAGIVAFGYFAVMLQSQPASYPDQTYEAPTAADIIGNDLQAP